MLYHQHQHSECCAQWFRDLLWRSIALADTRQISSNGRIHLMIFDGKEKPTRNIDDVNSASEKNTTS